MSGLSIPIPKAVVATTTRVAPVIPVKTPVALAAMKQVPELAGMALLRQSRLSVCPVSDAEWRTVCGLAGIKA